jgi:hypothetical protein
VTAPRPIDRDLLRLLTIQHSALETLIRHYEQPAPGPATRRFARLTLQGNLPCKPNKSESSSTS